MKQRVLMWLLLIFGGTHAGQAQPGKWIRQMVTNVLYDTVESQKPRLLAYPAFNFTPETSLQVGLSGLLLFHARNDAQTNRLSEITAYGFYSLRGQYGFLSDQAVYTHREKWLLLGRVRLQYLPLYYFGIGNDSREGDRISFGGSYILVRERFLRGVAKNLFMGLDTDLQRLSRVRFPDTPLLNDDRMLGQAGGFNLGLGASVIYDSRRNYLNPRAAVFAELSLLAYRPAWGSRFNFTSYTADLRRFWKLTEKRVMAFQLFGTYAQGEVPFNQLPMLGGESLMRGYYLGRFRDHAYFAAQAEHRWLPFGFSKRWGGAVFAALGNVAAAPSGLWKQPPRWAAGAGLRWLVLPKKDIFLRLDYARTIEGGGFYFFTGEAF